MSDTLPWSNVSNRKKHRLPLIHPYAVTAPVSTSLTMTNTLEANSGQTTHKRHKTCDSAAAAASAVVASSMPEPMPECARLPPTSPVPPDMSSIERARWNTRMEIRWELFFPDPVPNCAAPIFLWSAGWIPDVHQRLHFLRTSVAYYNTHQRNLSRLVAFIRSYSSCIRDPNSRQEATARHIQAIAQRIATFFGKHASFASLREWCMSTESMVRTFRSILEDPMLTQIELVVCLSTEECRDGRAISDSPDGQQSPSPVLRGQSPLAMVVAAAHSVSMKEKSGSPTTLPPPRYNIPGSPPHRTMIDSSAFLGISPLRNPFLPIEGMLAHSSPTETAETMIAVSLSPMKACAGSANSSPQSKVMDVTMTAGRLQPRPLVHIFSAQCELARMTARRKSGAAALPVTTNSSSLSRSHPLSRDLFSSVSSLGSKDNIVRYHLSAHDLPVAPGGRGKGVPLHSSPPTGAPTTAPVSLSPSPPPPPFPCELVARATSGAHAMHLASARLISTDPSGIGLISDESKRRVILQELYDHEHDGRVYPTIVSVVNALLHDAYSQPHVPAKMNFCRDMLALAADSLGVCIDHTLELHVALRTLRNK